MTLKYIVLAILFLLEDGSGCEHNPEYKSTICPSINSIIQTNLADTHILKIKNFGNQTLGGLRYHSFERLTELTNLHIQGLLNYIDTGALYTLNNLEKLELFNNKIERLPGDLFVNTKVNNVYIINSGVRNLYEGTFQYHMLDRVYVRNNSIKTIPEKVFSDSNISELYLDHNDIENINDKAFGNMTKLYRLSLNGNQLTTFAVEQIFDKATVNINRLWLGNNKISVLNRKMFSMLPKLKFLFLEMNNIAKIQDGAFAGLPNLVALDISNNRLQNVEAKIFPAEKMGKLEIFLFHNNRLTFLNNNTFLRTPELKYITFYGNPLQCTCYYEFYGFLSNRTIEQVCENNKVEKRPVCIKLMDPEINRCVNDVETTGYLYKDYKILTSEWEPWDLKCNFAEGYENVQTAMANKPYLN